MNQYDLHLNGRFEVTFSGSMLLSVFIAFRVAFSATINATLVYFAYIECYFQSYVLWYIQIQCYSISRLEFDSLFVFAGVAFRAPFNAASSTVSVAFSLLCASVGLCSVGVPGVLYSFGVSSFLFLSVLWSVLSAGLASCVLCFCQIMFGTTTGVASNSTFSTSLSVLFLVAICFNFWCYVLYYCRCYVWY